MDITFHDARKLWSLIWYEEGLIDKKRRWLQSTSSNSDGTQKRQKRPKFLTDAYLPESDLRSDQVAYENVKANIDRSFGESYSKHHVVQDYQQLLDTHMKTSDSLDQSSFFKTFSSMISDLSNDALCAVANTVTNNNLSFEKTRPRMKRIIKNYLPVFFSDSNVNSNLVKIQQLWQVFSNPYNLRKKPLTLITPISPPLLSSIQKTLEGLEEMTLQELVAVNRKLRGVTVVPQCPPVIAGKRDLLIERVRKRSNKLIGRLEGRLYLPKQLAKALSVVQLSLKHKSRRVDISTSEFFPFSLETVALQNDILKALWLMPIVKHDEIKLLQPQLDPKAKVPMKSFRHALRKYLLEFLFQCDEINLPDEALGALAFINRKSRRQPCIFAKEIREEEVEAVLNISCQLKAVISSLRPCISTDDECADAYFSGLGIDEDRESNDFELCGNNYFMNSVDCDQQVYGSCSNDILEATADSRPAFTDSFTNDDSFTQLSEAVRFLTGNVKVKTELQLDADAETFDNCSEVSKKPYAQYASQQTGSRIEMLREALTHGTAHITKKCKLEEDDHVKVSSCPEESKEVYPKSDLLRNVNQSETEVQEICDETALLAHRLIGCMLDKFIQAEGREVDELARHYLRDGSSPLVDHQGCKGSFKASKQNSRAGVLIDAVEDILPSLPKRCAINLLYLVSN
ncbi:uncharacterized protein LOC109723008 isoform X2 [Ananas comosus]|uniref:Uncharacterized protein LOC109723008 isoform X2 n=1 Tax=Ananas comosus TaxID=4615 RepID=A0A6P5GDU8_ANACO|nr:uncharacterized protein LOC109723008 isoform X2 [Ananas comosus]